MARLDLPPSTLTGPLRNYLDAIHRTVQGIQPTSGWTTTTSDFTLTSDYYRVRVKSSGTVVVYLPSATPFESWVFQVKVTPDSTGSVIVQAQAGQVVEGNLTASLKTAGFNAHLQSYASGWDLL